MTARSGRPRAVGGQSWFQADALVPGQSPSGPWRLHIHDGSERRIHDPPLKCSDSSRRPTSILKTDFFKKLVNLEAFFCGAFLPSSRWSRGTVKIQRFELATTLVGPSDFQNFFLGPLRAPEDPSGRGKFFAIPGKRLRNPWEGPLGTL